jgi:DnaJ-domain-containing protein 1
MFDRSSPRYWILRFLLGLALLAAAGLGLVQRLRIGDQMGLLTLLVGVVGFRIAFTSTAPMARALNRERLQQQQWSQQAKDAFARASLPRRVHYLLTAVAAADGPVTEAERAVVRHFLLERFGGPIAADEVRQWETQPLTVDDRRGLAARIAAGLDDSELDSLFCWCCLVAFADDRFRADEQTALREVAEGLGLPAARARMLFHLARAQFLAGDRRGERADSAGAGGSRASNGTGRSSRSDALATLGLPADATPEQIRKRHRELVRRFHPDAQPNLGPVAQREATERFTAIQRAYETLLA